ncbi:hypothetical protein FMEXI_11835 [Fusarium mexicanum]|uniref:Uncharacterized protein n=1 Tax=Fusarium mexicanum TaxID=751941 RepID=A0A8H5MLW3_9HYPO|nr:hypothetical protein FMEXI_11835 [Fusarium mexicanum]
MSFSTPPTFDHSKIGVCDVAARRAHMKAFFLHLGLWDEDKAKTYREFSEDQACYLVHVAGHAQVNQVFFEFLVDQILWHNILTMGNALGQGHDWPWTIEGVVDKTDVTTDGASQFYREWLHRKFGVSAEVQQIIATGQILNLNGLHSYRDYIPADIHVECLFSGVSARFPHHRIQTLDIPEVQRYVVATLEGAFPSRTKFYTNDEILLRTKYKIVRLG